MQRYLNFETIQLKIYITRMANLHVFALWLSNFFFLSSFYEYVRAIDTHKQEMAPKSPFSRLR